MLNRDQNEKIENIEGKLKIIENKATDLENKINTLCQGFNFFHENFLENALNKSLKKIIKFYDYYQGKKEKLNLKNFALRDKIFDCFIRKDMRSQVVLKNFSTLKSKNLPLSLMLLISLGTSEDVQQAKLILRNTEHDYSITCDANIDLLSMAIVYWLNQSNEVDLELIQLLLSKYEKLNVKSFLTAGPFVPYIIYNMGFYEILNNEQAYNVLMEEISRAYQGIDWYLLEDIKCLPNELTFKDSKNVALVCIQPTKNHGEIWSLNVDRYLEYLGVEHDLSEHWEWLLNNCCDDKGKIVEWGKADKIFQSTFKNLFLSGSQKTFGNYVLDNKISPSFSFRKREEIVELLMILLEKNDVFSEIEAQVKKVFYILNRQKKDVWFFNPSILCNNFFLSLGQQKDLLYDLWDGVKNKMMPSMKK